MPSRLLKTKASLPLNLEHRLVNKWGYSIEKRITGDFIMFKKNYISDAKATDGVLRTLRASVNSNHITIEVKPTSGTSAPITNPPASKTVETKIVPIFKNQLTPQQKKTLLKRCDNIVGFFPDPYSVPNSVRARLTIMMQKLTLPEAQCVLEYMDENFPAVDKGT